MGPYLLRVRRKCPPLKGLYPPRIALWNSNQSAISQRDWGFLTVWGGVDPRKLGFLPRLVVVLEIWSDLWTGDGTLPSRDGAGSTYEPQPIRDRPVGLGFPHRAGRCQPGRYPCSSPDCWTLDVWMDSDPGMRPYRARVTLTLCMNPGQ